MLDVLAVAPHPDDAELGMAGALLRFKSEGLKVGILDLTTGEPTPHGDPATRARETAQATAILGIDWRHNLQLVNRSLEPTLEARRQIAQVIRQVRPKWLFAPYWVDSHPDHLAAVELVEAARFWAKLTKSDLAGEPHFPERIFHYYSVHLRHVEVPSFALDISPFWPGKQAALECYKSQFITGRPTHSPTFLDRLRDRAAYWGWAIGTQYAEPFACREPVGLKSLRELL
jgi:bacillithiol biosynthesis deacetylase BshB1